MPIYNERYHDNCHDYLKKTYIEKYADKKYKDLLYQIANNIPVIDICQPTKLDSYADVIVCDQHAVVFGKKNDIYPILATYALNACVGLLFYVPAYGVASLAHIDGLPGYSYQSARLDGVEIDFDPVMVNIISILRKIRELSGTTEKLEIQYYLIGGIFDLSEIMVNDIINTINNLENNLYQFQFMGRNILGPANQSRNICFDTSDGKITYFDYTINSEFYQKTRNPDGTPLNIIRAPRKSEAFLDVTYVPISRA